MPWKLLIVDVAESDRTSARRALRDAGVDAELDEEANTAALLAGGRASSYDGLLLDDSPPGSDGLEILRDLRAAGVTAPIVVLAGQGSDERAVALMKAGAADYLRKDWSRGGELAQRLLAALRLHRAEEQRREAQRRQLAVGELFRRALEQMAAGVVVASAPGGELLLCNRRVEHLLGQPYAIAGDGRPGISAHDGQGAPCSPERWPLARSLADGEVVAGEELACERPDGRRVFLHASSAPVRDDDGRVVAAVMTLSDITAEHQAQEARREETRLYEEAQRALRIRDEVLAVVSHDLRNPLHTIALAAESLVMELAPAQRDRCVSTIRRGVERANRLIHDLLDASKIEAGKLAIEPTRQTVSRLLEQALRDHQPAADKRGVALSVQSEDNLPRVMADRTRVLQVLDSLVGNALRFTEPGGRIELAARSAGRQVRVSVSDTGAGIPPEELPQLFERYGQAEQQQRTGAGLALYIARGIIEAHGGTLSVESHTGVGTTFAFTLPIAD